MSNKIRFMFVVKDSNTNQYLARNSRFTSDFNKARIFKRTSDASNSINKMFILPTLYIEKVILVDPK